MMNMEKDPAEVGGAPIDFSRAYLPLHRQELAARKMHGFLSRLSNRTPGKKCASKSFARPAENLTAPGLHAVHLAGGGLYLIQFRRTFLALRRRRPVPQGPGHQQPHGDTPDQPHGPGRGDSGRSRRRLGNGAEINHGGGIVTKYGHMQRWAVQPANGSNARRDHLGISA